MEHQTHKTKRPLMREKIARYEKVLHSIQCFAQVTMDHDRLETLISNICSWSYAHRCGNGEIMERDQQKRIDDSFWNLTNYSVDLLTKDSWRPIKGEPVWHNTRKRWALVSENEDEHGIVDVVLDDGTQLHSERSELQQMRDV